MFGWTRRDLFLQFELDPYHLQLLKPTFGYDTDFVWGIWHRHLMRGTCGFGVTIKPA
jgi:hypothetical protein